MYSKQNSEMVVEDVSNSIVREFICLNDVKQIALKFFAVKWFVRVKDEFGVRITILLRISAKDV